MQATAPLPELLRLFADGTRLRALSILGREEVSVGELARALGLAQSRVSNHLRLLREAGLVRERRAGHSVYLRADWSGSQGERLWEAMAGELAQDPEHQADLVRLRRVLAERAHGQDAFFDRMAPHWDKIAGAFRTGQARQRAALHLMPRRMRLADLGCGTLYMGSALLGQCEELVCIDRSAGMLERARERHEPAARGTRLRFVQGELDALPLQDASLDGLVVGMVLHHLERTDAALRELRRVLRPGASAAILEIAPHREAWMRTELGDRRLGLAPAELLSGLERAGFDSISLDPVEDRYCPTRAQAPHAAADLELYVARGRVPETGRPAAGDPFSRS